MKIFLRNIITYIIEYQAKFVLNKYKPQIVVVVGSVGKTTTKDAIYAALSGSFIVRKSEKSFNSEIGIPLTILGCQNAWSNPIMWIQNIFTGFRLMFFKSDFPKWLVLEVGADKTGDIQKVSKWLKTDIVVLTRLPDVPVHVEFFDSPEDVVKEKLSIIRSLKEGGSLVLNGDDEKIRSVIEKHGDKKIITYGVRKDVKNLVTASYSSIIYKNKLPDGIRFKVNYDGENIPIEIRDCLGDQHIYPILAAVSVGSLCGIDNSSIADRFKEYSTSPGRMKLVEGVKNSLIIDDTYNSSPVAVHAALETLSNIKTDGKKIVMLGDMMELGQYSIEEHKKVGVEVAKICDELITVGFRARAIAEAALSNGMHPMKVLQYDDVVRAGNELEARINEHDIVLMKASQSIRMEKAVEEIMAHPEGKHKLLARQDEEWLKR